MFVVNVPGQTSTDVSSNRKGRIYSSFSRIMRFSADLCSWRGYGLSMHD